MSQTPLKALVFDLGGVIVGHDDAMLYARLASRCTAPDALERISAQAHSRAYGTGELSIADLHRRFVDELGCTADWPTFKDDWCCHLTIDPDMLAFVEGLAGRHRVMIFSNTNAEHWDFLVELSEGRLGKLEAWLSYEIGDAKPALSSFATVARGAGIEPAASLFIDDRADNVDAARQAGFRAELFTGKAALERRLAAEGLVLAS